MDSDTRFRALFDEHYRAVARYLLARGYQASDADDLIAETFEVAWRRRDVVPDGRDAVPWLLAVARNLSRNAHRRSRRELAFLEELARTASGSADLPVEPRAELALVMRALGELSTLDRDLILLVAWDELTPTEAGQVLGLRAVTARSRLHRARLRLRACLTGGLATTAVRAQEPRGPVPGAAQIATTSASTIQIGVPHDA